MVTPDFRDDAQALVPDLVDLRRSIHREPEVGLDLPRTQAKVLDALGGLDLEITTGTGLSSVTAVLRGAKPGPTVLLRGDMDALPIEEDVDIDFAATNGNMHACGHDLHVAGLVGAARLLSAHRADLAGNVIFMFQPGEESPGGAKPMIDEGLLAAAGDPPVAAYAIHVTTAPYGAFLLKPGTIMSSRSELQVTLRGKGAHGSRPHLGVDPVAPVAEIVTALNTMVTKSFDVLDPVVLSVTQLSGSRAANVIPESAGLGASIRTLSEDSLVLIQERVREVVEGIAAAHRCTADIDFTVDYPVTVNDEEETQFASSVLEQRFGADRLVPMTDPRMGSEDFSFVLNAVPGTFLFLGATPEGMDTTGIANHSPRVQFDDRVLSDQSAALAQLAWERLQ
ncbi:MAG TPA: M20 family metallopeptidase [Brevibacterium sp.]|nr:M20 family metallopeptidase [Brevibacterium sp.]